MVNQAEKIDLQSNQSTLRSFGPLPDSSSFRCFRAGGMKQPRDVVGDRFGDLRIGRLGRVAVVDEYQVPGIVEDSAQVMKCRITP